LFGILGKKEEIKEGRKAGTASKTTPSPPPPPPLAQGLDLPLRIAYSHKSKKMDFVIKPALYSNIYIK